MSEIADAIQAKCLAFGDRIIKLNDYLLEQAAVCKTKSSQPSAIKHQTSRVPVHLLAVATLCNQLLRAGTSIGANNAEACNAISKADFKSKSYIAFPSYRFVRLNSLEISRKAISKIDFPQTYPKRLKLKGNIVEIRSLEAFKQDVKIFLFIGTARLT